MTPAKKDQAVQTFIFSQNPFTLQGLNDQELQAQKTAMDANPGQSRGEEAGREAAPKGFVARAHTEVAPRHSIQPGQSPFLFKVGTWHRKSVTFLTKY